MKTLVLIFAMIFTLNQVTLATQDSTKISTQHTTHTNTTAKVQISKTFLVDMIEADALLEQDMELYDTHFSKNFIQDLIEQNAMSENQAYIADFNNVRISPTFLQDIIEENANRAK